MENEKVSLIPEFYTEECEPIKCEHCGEKQFEEKIKDTIANTVCEYEIICKGCKAIVGYWAYGSYDPAFAHKEL